MHADGTIYHRYGSRTGAADAHAYLGLDSLSQLLRDTVVEHRSYDRAPKPASQRPPRPVIELPALKQRLALGQKIDCVHCHTIHDAEFHHAVAKGMWQRDQAFVFPDPERVGFTLDRRQQTRVIAVMENSAAAKAGVKVGDELASLAEQHTVRTLSDVQWALHQAPTTATKLSARLRRGDDSHDVVLTLAAGWKQCAPEDYAWRPFKWNLSPSPGFGGPMLSAFERERVGLTAASLALRVQYLVDWGKGAHRGRAAKAAGLAKGDLVVAFAGRRQFVSFDHFHAFIALTLTAGVETEIVVWRQGKEVTLRYALPK